MNDRMDSQEFFDIFKNSVPVPYDQSWPTIYPSMGTIGFVDAGVDFVSVFLELLDPNKEDYILDIGSLTNQFIRVLHTKGYSNAYGIDVDEAAENFDYSRCIQFRDLTTELKFDIIFFNKILDFFEGGMGDRGGSIPSLEMLAKKMNEHLYPGGKININDCGDNLCDFLKTLEGIGYKDVSFPPLDAPWYRGGERYHIFQKPD